MRLDARDRVILHELDLNARIPASKLGKKLRISRESVAYRIRELENAGVIQGYYGIINVYALGYTLYKLFISFKDCSHQEKTVLIEKLRAVPEIGLISHLGGQYDLSVGIVGKDNFVAENIITKLLHEQGHIVHAKDISIITDLRQYNKKFLGGETQEWHISPQLSMTDLDELDKKILQQLARDAKRQLTTLAQQLNIDRGTLQYRIKRLEKEGVLLGYRVILNREHFQRNFFRILIKLNFWDKQALNSLLTYLQIHPQTVFALKCIGTWEFEIEISPETLEQCYSFISDLKEKHKIIKEYLVLPAFKDLKYEFFIE